MTAKLHTVHVRVNDAATGQPTPVRIRFETADGTYLPPFGRINDVPAGWGIGMGGNVLVDGRAYAHIDGTCEISLPADPVSVEITKGPEYAPIREEVILGPGKMALRFAVSRWIDLRSEGWYSGDICAYFLSAHAALLEGAAEDLAVVNILAQVWPWHSEPDDERETKLFWIVPNILEFSGQQAALQVPGAMVVVNTHNWHHRLGHLALLNCHRAVYPLTFGGSSKPDDWTLADWCDQCHRKGGLVVLFYSWRLPEGGAACVSEGLADLILGKVDAVHVDGGVDPGVYEAWYALLNCSLRATPVAGSSKASNTHVLGTPRTYAHLRHPEELTYKNWIEAIRAGRTFVTNGPLVSLVVAGAESGDTVDVAASAEAVRIRAQARSLTPLSHLEIVYNGHVVARGDSSGSPATATIETTLTIGVSGWLAARCVGANKTYAHTGPIYVRVDGKNMLPVPEALAMLLRQLDNTLDWVRDHGRFEDDRQRACLTCILQSAREELASRGK